MWSVCLISSFETTTCNQLGTFLSSYHFAERFKLGGAAHMRSCCDTQVEGRAGKLKTDWTNPLAPAVVLRLFYGH